MTPPGHVGDDRQGNAAAAEVVALLEVVPERYRASIWLGAGEALRISEALGVADSPRCADFDRQESHVVQQLRYGRANMAGST